MIVLVLKMKKTRCKYHPCKHETQSWCVETRLNNKTLWDAVKNVFATHVNAVAYKKHWNEVKNYFETHPNAVFYTTRLDAIKKKMNCVSTRILKTFNAFECILATNYVQTRLRYLFCRVAMPSYFWPRFHAFIFRISDTILLQNIFFWKGSRDDRMSFVYICSII